MHPCGPGLILKKTSPEEVGIGKTLLTYRGIAGSKECLYRVDAVSLFSLVMVICVKGSFCIR